MSNNQILYAEVKALLAQAFAIDVEQLSSDTRLVDDLYADSMELLDLVLALNEHYKIEIGPDDLLTMRTVDGVGAVIERLTAVSCP